MDVDSNSNHPLGVRVGGAGAGGGGDAEGWEDGKEGKNHGQHPPTKSFSMVFVAII
jgi:hypothetical protein